MLKPEDAERVLTKNLANVIRKANTGKPLTAAERALIEQTAASGSLSDSSSAFTKTYDELAQRLGVTRKTLQNAQKRFPGDAPRPRADGRHDVAAWSQFVIKHNIARSAENIAQAASEETQAPITVTDWKAKELELKCEKLQIENAKVAGELVEAAEVETGLSALMSAVRQGMNNFAPRLAGKMLNISDYHEAEEIIQSEVDVLLRIVHQCDFLDGLGPEISPYQPSAESVAARDAAASVIAVEIQPSGLIKGKPRGKSRNAAAAETPDKAATKKAKRKGRK